MEIFVNRLRQMFVCFLMSVILCAWLALSITADPANAETVTDDLTIKIGYWGMSEKEYVEKANFHWTELAEMYGGAANMPEIAYSYFKGKDSGSYKIVVVAARGALLEDVLNQAGVNISDVKNLSFYTNDYTEGAFASFTPYQLIEEPRYYYDNLASHIDNKYNDLGVLVGYKIDSSAEENREAVPTMLALESNWSEFSAGAENTDPVFTGMMTGSRFRLLFGQNAADETNMTSKSAKYVHTIAVTMPGSPVIKTGSGAGSGKIMLSTQLGRHTVTFNVATDEAMIDSIKEKLEWKSSDESVLKINDIKMAKSTEYDDAVTVVIDYEVLKKGNASINGSYMGMNLSGSTIATDENAPDDKTDNNSNNNNDKSGKKTPDGKKTKNSNAKDKGNKSGKDKSWKGSKGQTSSGSSTGRKEPEKKLSLTKKGGTVTARTDKAADPKADDSGLVEMDLESAFENDDTKRSAILEKEDDGKNAVIIGAGAGVLMLTGGVSSLLHFSSETGGAASRFRRRRK
jgi:hypothetical protein